MMDRFGVIAPKSIVCAAAHFLFWPITLAQHSMYRLGWLQWYSQVFPLAPDYRDIFDRKHTDSYRGRVLLGGLPWPSSTQSRLLEQEHVSAVINLVSEKNIEFPVERRLDIPLTDFAHPSAKDISPAVDFLDECVREGRTVYVHCRAGKARSATVVMCWLVSKLDCSPELAQEYLSRVRPQILSTLKNREVVKHFIRPKN